jgi:hypothetical protein
MYDKSQRASATSPGSCASASVGARTAGFGVAAEPERDSGQPAEQGVAPGIAGRRRLDRAPQQLGGDLRAW